MPPKTSILRELADRARGLVALGLLAGIAQGWQAMYPVPPDVEQPEVLVNATADFSKVGYRACMSGERPPGAPRTTCKRGSGARPIAQS